MIDGFPLSFFLPLVVHALAGLTTGVTGVLAFRAPKRRGRHQRWGTRYLWAYTVVFLTATILSVQRWPADAYLFALATRRIPLTLCSQTHGTSPGARSEKEGGNAEKRERKEKDVNSLYERRHDDENESDRLLGDHRSHRA